MQIVSRHLSERLHHVAKENRELHYRRLHRQPHKAQLRQGASCPSCVAAQRKPPVRRLMVYMGRPRQSEQDVDIKQGDGLGYHPGFRNSLAAPMPSICAAAATSSGPNPGVPDGTWNTGKPLRVLNGVRAMTPRLASSDKAAPIDTLRAAASARAASRTSLSTSRVVRILILW